MQKSDVLPRPKKSFYSVYIKRLLDIVLSGLAIIVLSPLFLVVSIMELVFHGWPVLYKQKRTGLNGKDFYLYKFRSMTNKTDENGELLPDDKRLTTFGRALRRFSIDELPELFSIFTGKMSIIGPRPLLPRYLERYSPRHRMRLSVRPGLALVSLKPMKTWTWNAQFENDIYYIENISFCLDVMMVFAVAKEAIRGSDYRVEATREEYTGDNLDFDAVHAESRSKELFKAENKG